jgi:ATP-binding cassette subfamily F protein 3
MLLLSCSRLCRGFDEGPLFEDIGFELYAGDRVGLVGPNGVGKTTLLRLLAGVDRPDDGEVRWHAGARTALLQQQAVVDPRQTLFGEARAALDEYLAAHDDMVRTAEALAQATDDNQRRALASRYDRLNELLRHHDAYNIDHRVEEVLDGLGFQPSEYHRAINTFSGGQLRRLMLAKILLACPDVMLLDEPSNHLDISATRWLEEYLVRQPEAMLIVSHDRYFLDRVVTRVFELHSRRLSCFPGNYQAYWRQRQERYEREFKEWQAQQEYIARQEDYINRVHYGQLHKQAQSRRKALERLERIPRPTRIESPHLHFGDVRRAGDVVLQVDELSKAFDTPLFNGLSFSLPRGKRLGIMGPNGSGKTTLLHILMGQEEPTSGQVQVGHQVDFGYLDQHLKELVDDQPVLKAVWPEPDPEIDEQRMRNLLARFGLLGDQIYQPVGQLSGGERSRLALARLVAREANVLVLDEPTNHLDLWACEALEQALLEFEGTVIVVSHDRYFLNRVVELLIVLEDGHAQVIHGNYDTYERMRALQSPKPSADEEREALRETEPANNKNAIRTPRRKRRFPYRKVEDLEADIAAGETRLRELEQLLASPALYRDGEKVKETTRAFEETRAQLQQLYEHWEEAVELH